MTRDPKAASSYDGDAAAMQEACARYHDDAAERAEAEYERACKDGISFGSRANQYAVRHRRYAAEIRELPLPTSDASERLREAVQHEIDQLRTADSSWAVGIRTRLKAALSNARERNGDAG